MMWSPVLSMCDYGDSALLYRAREYKTITAEPLLYGVSVFNERIEQAENEHTLRRGLPGAAGEESVLEGLPVFF